MIVEPSQTLYVKNINDKVKIPELKKSLFELMTLHGEILNIVAQRGDDKRGQAWVVFKDIISATSALRAFQKYKFYDKPLTIQFAKAKSDVVSRLDGTYVPRDKKVEKVEKKVQKGATFKELPETSDSPSPTLFVQDLAADMTSVMVEMLFRQYPGFKEVRLNQSRAVAFVDFDDEMKAGVALHGLRGFVYSSDGKALNVTYAKK